MSDIKQGLNGMVVEAFAKVCENKCKDYASCTENCDDMQRLMDRLFEYPTIYSMKCPHCDEKIIVRREVS